MSIAELRKLSSEEKLRIVEVLWGDLITDGCSFASPSWHEKELRETEAKYEAGLVEAIDWDTAKKELRQRFE